MPITIAAVATSALCALTSEMFNLIVGGYENKKPTISLEKYLEILTNEVAREVESILTDQFRNYSFQQIKVYLLAAETTFSAYKGSISPNQPNGDLELLDQAYEHITLASATIRAHELNILNTKKDRYTSREAGTLYRYIEIIIKAGSLASAFELAILDFRFRRFPNHLHHILQRINDANRLQRELFDHCLNIQKFRTEMHSSATNLLKKSYGIMIAFNNYIVDNRVIVNAQDLDFVPNGKNRGGTISGKYYYPEWRFEPVTFKIVTQLGNPRAEDRESLLKSFEQCLTRAAKKKIRNPMRSQIEKRIKCGSIILEEYFKYLFENQIQLEGDIKNKLIVDFLVNSAMNIDNLFEMALKYRHEGCAILLGGLYGKDIQTFTRQNATEPLLHEAVRANLTGYVRHYFSGGKPYRHIAEEISSKTPLDIARELGHDEIVNLLQSELVKSEQKRFDDYIGSIACEAHCYDFNYNVIDVNAQNTATRKTALHIAVETGHVNHIRDLLANNIDILLKDRSGRTAKQVALELKKRHIEEMINIHRQLMVAIKCANVLLVEKYIVNGAFIYTRTHDDHSSVLHVAVKAALTYHNKMFPIIEVLAKSGANFMARNMHGQTAKALALNHGLKDIATLLTNLEAKFQTAQRIAADSVHGCEFCMSHKVYPDSLAERGKSVFLWHINSDNATILKHLMIDHQLAYAQNQDNDLDLIVSAKNKPKCLAVLKVFSLINAVNSPVDAIEFSSNFFQFESTDSELLSDLWFLLLRSLIMSQVLDKVKLVRDLLNMTYSDGTLIYPRTDYQNILNEFSTGIECDVALLLSDMLQLQLPQELLLHKAAKNSDMPAFMPPFNWDTMLRPRIISDSLLVTAAKHNNEGLISLIINDHITNKYISDTFADSIHTLMATPEHYQTLSRIVSNALMTSIKTNNFSKLNYLLSSSGNFADGIDPETGTSVLIYFVEKYGPTDLYNQHQHAIDATLKLLLRNHPNLFGTNTTQLSVYDRVKHNYPNLLPVMTCYLNSRLFHFSKLLDFDEVKNCLLNGADMFASEAGSISTIALAHEIRNGIHSDSRLFDLLQLHVSPCDLRFSYYSAKSFVAQHQWTIIKGALRAVGMFATIYVARMTNDNEKTAPSNCAANQASAVNITLL